jgi:HAD superfamily hydrolase (TIGR01484 family)
MAKENLIFVFDVDGTLAPFGKPIEGRTAGSLRMLEAGGHYICFASGKPCTYVAGIARGMGLHSKYAIGENGGAILTGENILILTAERPKLFDDLQAKISRLLPKAYFQDNYINVTVITEKKEELDLIVKYLEENRYYGREGIVIYRHEDAVEINPEGISKGKALKILKSRPELKDKKIIAAGDGENDLSMKYEADEFCVVGDGLPEITENRFKDIDALLEYLLDRHS